MDRWIEIKGELHNMEDYAKIKPTQDTSYSHYITLYYKKRVVQENQFTTISFDTLEEADEAYERIKALVLRGAMSPIKFAE